MTEMEAIRKRISCRAYQEKPLPSALLGELEALASELSEESGLRVELLHSDAPERPVVKMAGAMFSGKILTLALLIGPDTPLASEKLGYYGEKLVLRATALGLGSCWVAGTYDPSSVKLTLGEGEKLWDIIPLGYPAEKTPAKQSLIRAAMRRRDRKTEQFVESSVPFAALPAWLQTAAEALRLGPSAVNQQPVNLVYIEGRLFMKIIKSGHGLEYNDMGIAKYQTRAAAEACGVRGHWQWGDGGEFILE